LWKQSAHAKLLQRPPAQKISPKQAALLQDTGHEILNLKEAMNQAAASLRAIGDDSSTQSGLTILDPILAARPVATLSQLLVWLQQGVALLRLPELAAELGRAADSGAAAATGGSSNGSSSSSASTSTSTISRNGSAAAETAAATAFDVSSRSSAGGDYGHLWFICTLGMLGHALAAADSCLALVLCWFHLQRLFKLSVDCVTARMLH
jgi:hypothetical protein